MKISAQAATVALIDKATVTATANAFQTIFVKVTAASISGVKQNLMLIVAFQVILIPEISVFIHSFKTNQRRFIVILSIDSNLQR